METVSAAAKLAYDNGVKVILNPAPALPLSDDLLRCVTILTPNETEAGMLTKTEVTTPKDAERAARMLVNKGVDQVLVTMGPKGVCAVTASELIPGFAVEAVDSTAAGDVFNGVLAVAVAEGKTLSEAAAFANAAGALSVTRLGAQPSAPARAEIDALWSQNPKLLL